MLDDWVDTGSTTKCLHGLDGPPSYLLQDVRSVTERGGKGPNVVDPELDWNQISSDEHGIVRDCVLASDASVCFDLELMASESCTPHHESDFCCSFSQSHLFCEGRAIRRDHHSTLLRVSYAILRRGRSDR